MSGLLNLGQCPFLFSVKGFWGPLQLMKNYHLKMVPLHTLCPILLLLPTTCTLLMKHKPLIRILFRIMLFGHSEYAPCASSAT
jgi:hypothetical protein